MKRIDSQAKIDIGKFPYLLLCKIKGHNWPTYTGDTILASGMPECRRCQKIMDLVDMLDQFDEKWCP